MADLTVMLPPGNKTGTDVWGTPQKVFDELHAEFKFTLDPCTDVRWWHEYAIKGEVRFIRGRLKFGDAKHSAPFPSAIVVFAAIA